MGQTLLAALTSGLALAGVLAVGGAAAALLGRGMPHLGVAGVGVGAAAVASRLAVAPGGAVLALVAAVGAAAGVAAAVVDRRARDVDAPVWPPALLPDVAVLGLGLGLAALLRPSTAIELPLGPLGGLASTAGGVTAGAVGLAGAAIVGIPAVMRRRPALGCAVATAILAVAVAVGGGAVAIRGEALMPAFGVADVVGLSLRAAAVGVFARRGVLPGLVAAVVLGVGEALLRAQLSVGEAAALPAVVVLAVGLWAIHRAAPPVPAA